MTLEESLSNITDPRRAQGQRISLNQALSIIIISNLCGHFGGRAVARFAKIHSDDITELCKLKHGVPSHVTFSHIINRINQREMIEALNNWACKFTTVEKGEPISGDGKALGSTVKNVHGSSQDFQAVVSLFSQRSGLVYALETYRNAKQGEAGVVRALCSKLKGMGVTIVLDALHTQKKQLSKS